MKTPSLSSASPFEKWRCLLPALGLVFFLQIYNHGYFCLRGDHLTHIPLLLMNQDPSLFARDWFLQNYGHFELRWFHLRLIQAFSFLGLSNGILLAYVLLIMGSFVAWCQMGLKVFGARTVGLAAALMAVSFGEQDLGSNHLIEIGLIPRAEAAFFAYWALWALLNNRALLGAVFLAVAGCFQPAFALLWGPALIIWLIVIAPGKKGGWKQALLFAVALILLFTPRVLQLQGAFTENAGHLKPSLEVQLAAKVRHPHHMAPLQWGWMAWSEFLLLYSLFTMIWWRTRRRLPEAWRFGLLGQVFMGLLALGFVFTVFIPLRPVVLMQPFRLAVPAYLVFFLFIGWECARLLREGNGLERMRAILLLLLGQFRMILVPLAGLEAIGRLGQFMGRPFSRKVWVGLLLAIFAVGMILGSDERKMFFQWAFGLAICYGALYYWHYLTPTRIGKALTALLGILVLWSALCWLPWERWMPRLSDRQAQSVAKSLWSYQLRPFPMRSLEKLAFWARENTPQDALFMIPPEMDWAGFRLWSHRSLVFSIKFFPFSPAGVEEWLQRYLHMRGVFPEAPSFSRNFRPYRRAINDIGAGGMKEAYAALSQEELLFLARKYQITHVITPALHFHPELELLRTATDPLFLNRENYIYFLYRFRPKGGAEVLPDSIFPCLQGSPYFRFRKSLHRRPPSFTVFAVE